MNGVIQPPCLIVALPHLQDPHFSKSVVLLIENSEEGSLGFIVNKPSSLSLKNMIDFDDVDIPFEIPTWYGGPVDTATGIILHNQPPSTDDKSVGPNVYLASSPEILKTMIEHARSSLNEQKNSSSKPAISYPYRFLVGYSGWGTGQLEYEMRHQSWIELPFQNNLIFNVPWNQMWDAAMHQVGMFSHTLALNTSQFIN